MRLRKIIFSGMMAAMLLMSLAGCAQSKQTMQPDGSAVSMQGSGADMGSASATEDEPETQEDLPASQQESEQYLKIQDDTTLPAYALEYPGLYSDAVREPNVLSDQKVVYLTFDDGPSVTNTGAILDILQQYDAKATFFVVAKEIDGNKALIQRMIDEGHTLCIHANEHVYGNLYGSVEAYLADFAAAYDKIYELTGYRVQGFRFPGGSNNVIMQRHATYDAIVAEMTRRGFEYYDWNSYDHDAENGNYSVQQLTNYALNEIAGSSRNDTILLMHDALDKTDTVKALPGILEGLRNQGIPCLPITNTTRPVHFSVDDATPVEYVEPEPAQETVQPDTAEPTE